MVKKRTMRQTKYLLIIANIIVGIAIYFSLQNKDDNKNSFNEILISTLSDLHAVTLVEENNGIRVCLIKNQTEWFLEEPYKWEADKLALSSFQTKLAHLNIKELTSLENLKQKGEILEDYGINEKTSLIKLRNSDSIIEFRIGNLTRDRKSAYCLVHSSKLKEKKIYRIDKEIIEFCKKSPKEWTNTTFIKTPLYAIDSISITFEGSENLKNKTNLVKKDQNWFFTEPFSGEADTEKVLFQLNSLISSRILDFKVDDSHLDIVKNSFKARLEISGFNETETFEFQSIDNDVITGITNSSKTKFRLEKEFLSLLSDWSTQLRSRSIFNFSENEIETLEVAYGNKKVSFFKDNLRQWQTSEGNSTTKRIIKADVEDIKTFFREMNSATVDQFLSTKIDEKVLTNLNIGEPVYKLNVKSSDSSTNSYFFNRTTDEDKMWTVIDQKNGLVCLIQKDFNKLLKITSINFRTKNLLDEKFIPGIIMLHNYDNNKSFSIECNRTETTEPLNNLSAETFLDNAFSEDGTWVNGDWIPWKYSLSFSEHDKKDFSGTKFLLSDRKGAGTWYGGDPKSELIFQFPINVIDSLSYLTENVK
jgi:hypothetical protein